MPPAVYQRERIRLAQELRKLRQNKALSGNRLAQQLGWAQSKVSKIETAKQLPTEDDIKAWTSELDAPADRTQDLLDLLDRARVEYITWRDSYKDIGAAATQADIMALEANATRIGEFQPAMISGLVQTAEYARELLKLPGGVAVFGADEPDIDQLVALRIQRQQVLYEPGKQVQLVLLEGALRSRVCSQSTHIGQLDRLIALTGLPSLELTIIPFQAIVPVIPLNGFRIYDDNLVIVETMTGEQQLNDPQEAAHYKQFFGLLLGTGARGSQAAEVIMRVVQDLRS